MNTEDVHTVLEVARRVEPAAELTFRMAAIAGVAPTGRLHDLEHRTACSSAGSQGIDCDLEMTTTDGCILSELKIDGDVFACRRCQRRRCHDAARYTGSGAPR
jgi:hypothetical protein